MKAIVVKDLTGLGNEGKEVDVIVQLPKNSGVSVHHPGDRTLYRTTVQDAFLISGISRMQNGKGEVLDVTIVYGGYEGTDLVTEEEIAFIPQAE